MGRTPRGRPAACRKSRIRGIPASRYERKEQEMTKLSEQLRLLADRAAAIEARAEAAREGAVEKRDERVAEAQARLKDQQEAFSSQVTAMSEEAQAAWGGVKDSLKSTGDKMRSKVEQGVHTLEAKDAKASADWAEDYAYRRNRIRVAGSSRGRCGRDGIHRGPGPRQRAGHGLRSRTRSAAPRARARGAPDRGPDVMTSTTTLGQRAAETRTDNRPARPVLIVNPKSGNGRAAHIGLIPAARDLGLETVTMQPGEDLARLANNMVDRGCDHLMMAGGDGSLAIVAEVAMTRDVPFSCVPVGTRNHFAMDLGLDRKHPLRALDAAADGQEKSIDVGLVAGRIFLNNVSFGLYAQAIADPDYRSHRARSLADAALDTAKSKSQITVTLPDGRVVEDIEVVLASNNPYRFIGPPDFAARPALDTGALGIIVGDRHTRLKPGPTTFTRWEAQVLMLHSESAEIRAGVDGELRVFRGPVEIGIAPQALRVLVPRQTAPRNLEKSIEQIYEGALIHLSGLPALPERSELEARSPLLQRLHNIDTALFERIAGRETPALDRAMPALSDAASHSKIWIAVALVMSLVGGRKGRRTAVESVVAVGITSFLANLVAKSLFRRQRPTEEVPEERRLPLPKVEPDALGPCRVRRSLLPCGRCGLSVAACSAHCPCRRCGVLQGLHRSPLPGRCLGRLAAGKGHRIAGARSFIHCPTCPPRSTPTAGRRGCRTVIADCVQYHEGLRMGAPSSVSEAGALARRGPGFVSLSLHEPDPEEMQRVAAAFNLPASAVEDRLEDHQRPKLEDYGDCVLVVVKAVRYDQATSRVDMGEIDVFLGASYAITVARSDSETIAGARCQTRTAPVRWHTRSDVGPLGLTRHGDRQRRTSGRPARRRGRRH